MLPFWMTKVVTCCPRCQDEVIVMQHLLIFHDHLLLLYIYPCHLCHQDARVPLPFENSANGACDISRRETCCRNLIKHRLKEMEIVAVDNCYLDRLLSQFFRRPKTTKAASDNNHMRCCRCLLMYVFSWRRRAILLCFTIHIPVLSFCFNHTNFEKLGARGPDEY